MFGGGSFALEAEMHSVSAMMAYVVSEGRLCALKPSEWSMLLVGVALCGFIALLFWSEAVLPPAGRG
jgi:hypothetical protein